MRIACAAVLALAPVAAAAAPTDAQIAAIALPEPQLRGLLARVVFATQTVGMGSYALGIDGACRLIVPAFDAAVAKHLPAWRANLVRAYRGKVPPAVLDKAAAAGPVAGAPGLLPYLDAVGGEMQRVSEPLLKQAASEVLLPVMTAMGEVDTAQIDGAARGRELSAALDNGTAQCGLSTAMKRPA